LRYDASKEERESGEKEKETYKQKKNREDDVDERSSEENYVSTTVRCERKADVDMTHDFVLKESREYEIMLKTCARVSCNKTKASYHLINKHNPYLELIMKSLYLVR